MIFKIGQRVVLRTPPGEIAAMRTAWEGVIGTVCFADKDAFSLTLDGDKNNRGAWTAVASFYNKWGRPLVPLSPLEELIAAYVEAQKAELGI